MDTKALTMSIVSRVLLVLMLSLSTVAALSSDMTAKLEQAKTNMLAVQSLATNMASDENTRTYVGVGRNIAVKTAEFGKKWVKTAKLEFSSDPEGNADRIGGAIAGVGEGIVGFVNGIKNNDWKGGVQGALSIISSVVALAGPMGMVASSVLSMISSLFDLFGGSEETESMDDKMERIVAEQINIGRAKDLKADFEGLKVAYRSLTASVQNFRETKTLEEAQANELYNHAFLELPIFGKLQAMINEICDDVQKNEDSKYKDGNKCLGFIQRYAEASILRQLLLTNMASLMADVHERTHGEFVQGTEKNNRNGTLLVVSNNLLNLIKKEKETDRTAFRFLIDPFNNPSRRYVIAVFFANPDKYPTLRTYLKSLDEDGDLRMYKTYAMLCSDDDLMGDCVAFEQGQIRDLNENPKNWRNKVSSFYLPRGFKLTGWDNANFSGTRWGPYAGPTVQARYPHKNAIDSVKIQRTMRRADREVRFCEQPRMEMGNCVTAPPGKYDLKHLVGRNWEGKLKSMYIPAGLQIQGYTQPNQKGIAMLYHGPYTVNLVYNENNWKSVYIQTTTEDAREDVEICDEPQFGGHCVKASGSTNQLEHLRGTNFDKKVKSMKIPGGMHVTGYTEIDRRGAKLGPYKGPAVISQVDLPELWRSLEISKVTSRGIMVVR